MRRAHKLYVITLLMLMTSVVALAQQEVAIRVQVNRTVQGTYPTKIYQFQSTPGLVTLTITNRTNSSYSLYLKGSITGDNGVRVSTVEEYRSASITLQPFETRLLNAIEIGSLFDPNRLSYLSGSTSIRASVFGEQGLPEGTYQICVRAFNAVNRQPLSEEDPLGCSNFFPVTTLEPPVILNPFDESIVRADPVQNIAIRWTTPPGAPPSTEYSVRIVELFNNRNPNDAILSTANPFFETVVRGTPLLYYTMQYPLLQEGRKYAIMVIASDPSGFATFRNGGRSEVVQFTYGIPRAGAAANGDTGPAAVEYATRVIKGRLVWTFKKTEQPRHNLYAISFQAVPPSPTLLPVTTYAGANITMQTVTTPLIKFNSLSAVIADKTLQQTDETSSSFAKTLHKPDFNLAQNLPGDIFTASHSVSSACLYETASAEAGEKRLGLSHATFTLSAFRTGSSGSASSLLATGATDAEGKFRLEFLDASFSKIADATHLVLSVQSDDFENTTFKFPAAVFNGTTTADLGDVLLLARTYRLFPKVLFPEKDQTDAGGYEYRIYRDAADVEDRPWLLYEGREAGDPGKVETVDGRRVVEVASVNVSAQVRSPSAIAATIPIDSRGVGRLFPGGKLYVKVIPSGSGFYSIFSTISTYGVKLPSNRILQAKATYKFTTRPSHIEGRVALVLEGRESIPVSGAIVRVLYRKDDVMPGTQPLSSALTSEVLAAQTSKYVASWTDFNSHDPGTTIVQAMAQSLLELSPPVKVLQKSPQSKLEAELVSPIVDTDRIVNTGPKDSLAMTATTNETGNYYIGNLPQLKAGSIFVVQVISVPKEFRTFVVRPSTGGAYPVVVALGKGISRNIDFNVDADVADVIGRVVDADGKPLINCRVVLKGNILSQTGPDGLFQFKLYPGKHTVSLEKEGYASGSASIFIPQLTGNDAAERSYRQMWTSLSVLEKQRATLTRISETPTVQASVARGNVLSPAMFGIAASSKDGFGSVATEFNASLAVAFGLGVDPATPQYETPRRFAVDVKDVGYLRTLTGKMRFRIVDGESGSRVPGVTLQLFDTTNITDSQGEWYYEGFGGAASVTVVPPSGSLLVAEKRIVNIPESGIEQVVTISLKKGIEISGSAQSGGQKLQGVSVWVDENDFQKVQTDNTGNYKLIVSPGEHTFKARKGNYVGQDITQTVTSGTTINFDLQGSGGKNYQQLLGFDVELASVEKVGNQERWSGSFVNLKPVNDAAINIDEKLRIDFSNLMVTFDGQGNAVPAGNQVTTDAASIPVKLFGFLPARIQSGGAITFRRVANGRGEMRGTVRADFKAVPGYRGWRLSDDVHLFLAGLNSATPEEVVVFSSGGSGVVSEDKYKLIAANATKASGKLYGFDILIDNGGVVDKDGIEFSGSISSPASGPIKSAQFGVQRLALNRSLVVSGVQLSDSNLPTLDIGGWKAGITAVIFHEDGFKLGGSLSVPIPRSGEAVVGFNDLRVASTGIFGGSFVVPEAGVNIVSVATLKGDGTTLSFGRVGNSNVYRIGGRANLKINVDITDNPFKVSLFEVMTNGNFTVDVPANYTTSLGPFGFSISNVYINAKDNSPFIGIQGGFRADFQYLKFDMADIKVRNSGSGPAYSIEKLGVKLDVPVVRTQALVSFSKDGFEGSGSLSVPGTPISADAAFKYFKRSSGIELGASFFSNLPPVPIGVLVTLDGIGGGFEYKSGGSNGGFAVDVRGKLSFLGTGPVVAIQPIGLTVSSAGILTGYGEVVVGTYLKTGNAKVIFNGPDRTFSVNVEAKMEPLEGLMSQSVQGSLVISAKPNDEFAFLGCAVNVKLLGLIDNHGELAVGVRVKNPKTRGDLLSYYFTHAPEDYMRERFSGVYINVEAEMGIPPDRPLGFDLFVASAKLWCSSGFHASLLLNLEEMAYRLRFGGKFDAGIEGCVADVACIGVSAALCYTVEGGRNDSDGWHFGATATGKASLAAGIGVGNCNPGCNEVRTLIHGCVGGAFRVCGGAALDLNFTQNRGLRFGARAASDVDSCF